LPLLQDKRILVRSLIEKFSIPLRDDHSGMTDFEPERLKSTVMLTMIESVSQA